MSISERNGNLVGAVQVFEGDELMLISNQGTLVRTRADEISQLGRNTQGVRVIRTKEGEHLVGVERIDEPEPELVFEEDADGSDPVGDESAISATSDNNPEPDDSNETETGDDDA